MLWRRSPYNRPLPLHFIQQQIIRLQHNKWPGSNLRLLLRGPTKATMSPRPGGKCRSEWRRLHELQPSFNGPELFRRCLEPPRPVHLGPDSHYQPANFGPGKVVCRKWAELAARFCGCYDQDEWDSGAHGDCRRDPGKLQEDQSLRPLMMLVSFHVILNNKLSLRSIAKNQKKIRKWTKLHGVLLLKVLATARLWELHLLYFSVLNKEVSFCTTHEENYVECMFGTLELFHTVACGLETLVEDAFLAQGILFFVENSSSYFFENLGGQRSPRTSINHIGPIPLPTYGLPNCCSSKTCFSHLVEKKNWHCHQMEYSFHRNNPTYSNNIGLDLSS